MPKRNAMTKKKTRKKIKLAANETLLADLHKMIEEGHEKAHTAQSLIEWYLQYKYWTVKQLSYVKVLVKTPKKKKATKSKKYYLYAIGGENDVKLGFSSDVRRRMKTLQTARPDTLKCLWRHYIGREEAEARKQEGKLHRYCKKHHIQREWYRPDCMVLVNQFSIKEKMRASRDSEDLDDRALSEIPECF